MTLMWPTPQDYNEAMQNPALAFDDAGLRSSMAELNALGLPRPMSGFFASVYHVSAGRGNEWAVRCFLHHFPDQEERYARISEFLSKNPLKYTVDFEFLARGIRIHGNWFPVLKMQWVNGMPLIAAIEARLQDHRALEVMHGSFVEMCKDLASNGIAHGDLQHGNILVCGDKLKLVDYDGMFVPSLCDKQSNELGHRNYQHPQRDRDHFNDRLDRFSAWSIHTSLYCLHRDPWLWQRLGAGDERLLFKHDDYVHPETSNAFYILENHESHEIRLAAKTFRAVVGSSIHGIAAIGDTIPGVELLPPIEKASALPAWLVSNQAGAAPTEHATNYETDRPTTTTAHAPVEILTESPIIVANKQNLQVPATSQAFKTPVHAPATARTANSQPPKNQTHPLKLHAAAVVVMWLLVVGPSLLALFSKPLKESKQANHTVSARQSTDVAVTSYNQGITYQQHRDYTAAIAAFENALSEFTRAGNQKAQAWCCYLLGQCHRELGDDNVSIEWLKKSIDTFRGDYYVGSPLFRELGELYMGEQKWNDAAYYLEKALSSNPLGLSKAAIAQELIVAGLEQLKQGEEQGLSNFKEAIAAENAMGVPNAVQYYYELDDAATQLEAKHEYLVAYEVRKYAYYEIIERQDWNIANHDNRWSNPTRALAAQALAALSKNCRLRGVDDYRDYDKQLEALKQQPAHVRPAGQHTLVNPRTISAPRQTID